MVRAYASRLTVVCLVVALSAGVVGAATVDTQITRVALFKNGLAFFSREGALPDRPGEIEIGPLPAASHGTFWLGWSPQAKIANLSSREVEVAESRLALTIPELLKANVGKRVRLEFASENRAALEGLLKSFPEAVDREPMNPYMAEPIRPDLPSGGQLLMIEAGRTRGAGYGANAEALVAIHPSSVDRIVFLEEAQTTVADGVTRVAVSGTLANRVRNGAVSVHYLAKGMTWAPSYLVDVSDPKQATLTAKAAILNDIEDLAGAQVDLVTGFPYLEFAEIISPLAKREDLAGFLNALGSGSSSGRGHGRYSGVTAQSMSNVAGTSGPVGAAGARGYAEMPSYGSATGGTVGEDLFFYPVEGVTLARGAVGYYPLFSEKIDYEHIYEWDIPDYMTDSDHYRNSDGPSAQIVWHSLRLTNGMKMPWTTAPATTMQDGRLLGQATLNYTPAGGETMVKITQAMGIKAEELELEVSRVPVNERIQGTYYDLVTVSGTLQMRSHLDKAVKVKITKMVSGEVLAQAPEAEVQKLAAGLRRINSRSRLTWEIEVKPGENVEITYQYKVHVRR